MAELALLVGLPAAGKSTFVRDRLAATHAVVSKDLMPNNRRREARQRELVAALLAHGRDVVVDNTNPRRADRGPLVALARAAGATVVGYYFPAAVRECLARNRRRAGRARVPDVAIFTAASRLEPPAADEGFDRLFVVTSGPGGGFDVTPRPG